MADFADLYDQVLPYLPGAEKPIVDLHIRRALREFFKRTAVWRETFKFDTIAGEATYQLQPSTGIIASIMSLHINGRFTHSVPEDRRDPFRTSGTPNGWYSLIPSVVTLYPGPTGAHSIQIEAAISLPIDDTLREFPDAVLQEHGEAIAAGVISGMMLMPGKPWTQRDAAAVYGRAFGSAIRDTRGKLRDGNQPNQSTFTPLVRFGA